MTYKEMEVEHNMLCRRLAVINGFLELAAYDSKDWHKYIRWFDATEERLNNLERSMELYYEFSIE